ncbi:VWA domain-containing protein [Falsihalocynthiibacter sp. SS001]|uniref:vWA domain-containing protein n=1 Tax=Falsihalocynthiibacter sp. SS001 TaxID=3349698 RepID=UPI0036D22630
MAEFHPLEIPAEGKLVDNITHFARALRRAGIPVGPSRVIEAIRAVEATGFTRKEDFYWVLHAVFVSKPEHRVVFAQVFRLFWRDPSFLEHMMSMLLPAVRGVQEERRAAAAEKRGAEALLPAAAPELPENSITDTEIEIDARRTASAEEVLRRLDFEQMSIAEMEEAKRMLAKLHLPIQPLKSRRSFGHPRGRMADWQATMRRAMRTGGEIQTLAQKKPRERWPNLVVLCDISGSMSQYSRAVLHFLHAVANQRGAGWAKVYGFTFGTSLTNITRHLAKRDVDAALALAGAEAQDWEGGTKIGECLHAFNRDWSRRVLGQGAVVILVSDGLDCGPPDVLEKEMERLHLSARQLIWLNPLLRYDGFAPKARGVAAMLPHVDSFRTGHNIASLEGLAEALNTPADSGEQARMLALLRQE